MNINTKRRAVYTVLSEVLDGDELWDVMWRWEEGYAQKSQYELNGFFNDCRDLHAIASNRSQLYRDLIGLLMRGTSGLKADPISQMEAYRQRNGILDNPVPLNTHEWMPCFSAVVQELMLQVPAAQVQQVRMQAEEQAQHRGVTPDLVYAFSMLALGKSSTNLLSPDFGELKTLLNLVYVAMCEQLGPVATDRMLSQAIERARKKFKGVDARLLLQHRTR